MTDDPLRMFLVLRKGGVTRQERACELGGAAAVACVRTFADAPGMTEWRARPGKVCLRARNPSQWAQVLEEQHALAGDPDGEAVIALPPRRRSERGPVLTRLQAMSSALDPLDEATDVDTVPGTVTFVVNPRCPMSSGKLVAQVAHAAVLAAETGALEAWIAAGCPARVVLAASQAAYDALTERDDLVARVVDAGLTEVPPGTVTVVGLV